MHARAALLCLALLLAPAALAALPAHAPARAVLVLTVGQDGSAGLAWRTGPAPMANVTSECYALAPTQLRCEGPDVNMTRANYLHFILAFDPEAASTDAIHIAQVVGTKVPFAYNCRAPEVVWLTLLLTNDAQCTTFGQPAFNAPMHVRLDIPYLPQEGIVSVGGWDASITD